MPTWPVSLPQKPLRDGYQEVEADTNVRTPMDTGPAKVRRRFTAGPRPFTCTFEFTGAQLATFKTFVRTTLLNGSLAFDMAEPIAGTTASFRQKSPPRTVSVGGDNYQTTWELEALP